jgi:hypothetical protein
MLHSNTDRRIRVNPRKIPGIKMREQLKRMLRVPHWSGGQVKNSSNIVLLCLGNLWFFILDVMIVQDFFT